MHQNIRVAHCAEAGFPCPLLSRSLEGSFFNNDWSLRLVNFKLRVWKLRPFKSRSECATASQPQWLAILLGSQHPSPNVNNPLKLRAENWLEIITSRDAQSACFEGSRMSCNVIIFGAFLGQVLAGEITSRDGCLLLIFELLGNRKASPQREATLAIVYRKRHRSRKRSIWVEKKPVLKRQAGLLPSSPEFCGTSGVLQEASAQGFA